METPLAVATANDVDLLRLTSEGDEPAYDELVARHRPALLAFATELADEQATADDLTDASLEALRERAGEAELIGAVRPFLLMTAADLSGADFDLTAECRGWDPLDAASQAVLWHTDIEGDPAELVALVSGVPVDELPAVVETARTAVGVPNGGDAALRARLTAYLLGPTASALAAAHAPAPAPAPAPASAAAPATASDDADALVAPDTAEPAEAEVVAVVEVAEDDLDATGEVPAVVDEPPAQAEEPDVDSEDDEPVDTTEDDLDATGEVPVVEPAAETPADEDSEPAADAEDPEDATREVPVVVLVKAKPPAASIAPPVAHEADEQPVEDVPVEHAAFVRPAPPPAPSPTPEPAMAASGPGQAPYAALDNEDTVQVPLIRPAKPVVYGSRTLTTVLAPVTAVAVVLLAVSLAGAAVLRDEPEAEFQAPTQGTTSKLQRDRPQETVPGRILQRKKKRPGKPSESPSATDSESPSETPSGTPSGSPSPGPPSPPDGTSPNPSGSASPSPTRPPGSTPPEPSNTSSATPAPTPSDTGTPTPTPTPTPPGP